MDDKHKKLLWLGLALGMFAWSRRAEAAGIPRSPRGSIFTEHTVAPGETLAKIGAFYEVTWERMVAANPQIANPNSIFPGQIVLVPE